MASHRAIKRQARRVLHTAMRVPAFYIVPVTLDQVPCYVRVHNEHQALGAVKGTSFAYAEREDTTPEIVFMRDQIVPRRGGIVSVEAGEAYCVDHSEAPDDITITSRVTRLDLADTVGLPVPATADNSFGATFDPIIFPRENPNSGFIQTVFQGITPLAPVALLSQEQWVMPLASAAITVDQRPALLQAHDFFAADRLRPYALNDQYYIRIDLAVKSFSLSNSVSMVIDIDGVPDEILTVNQTIPYENAGDEQPVSLFTRVYAKETFIANGAQIRLEFTNDAEITEAGVYLSL